MIQGAEFNTGSELNIDCYIKKTYSDDEQDRGPELSRPLKSYKISVNSLAVMQGVKSIDIPINKFEFI